MHPQQTYCRLTHRLPSTPQAAGQARTLVREFISCHGLGALVDDAVLLVSEVVTNALRHAAGEPVLLIALTATSLNIEVADGGSGIPSPREAEDADSGGRGLWLVDRMASRWGFRRAGGVKSVWYELDLSPAQSRNRRE